MTGVTSAAHTYFTNDPTFGFNEKVSLAKIASPANFLIISDAARFDKALGRGSLTPQYLDPATGTTTSYDTRALPNGWTAGKTQAAVSPRHSGGSNVAYSDGHVKYKTPDKLWRSVNDNDFRTDPSVP